MQRVVQITDTHIYAGPDGRFDGLDTRSSLAAVLGDIDRRGLSGDVLLATGDLAMDGSDGAYIHLAAALASAPQLICIPGNHDEPQVIARAAPRLYRSWPCRVDLGCWHLLCLDTRVADQPHGRVGAAQRAWLARALAGIRTGHVALVMHHPPLAIDSPWLDPMGLREGDALWAIIEAHSAVRLIVSGHVHQNVDRFHGRVRVLTTPSTCVQFAPRATRYARDPRPPGYRVLELGDDGGIVTAVVRVAL